MSYAFFAAFVGTGIFIGRLIDAAIGRLYDPTLKKWLQDGSLSFNEVKYWDIVSTSPERAVRVHSWISGRRFFSWQALAAAILMSLSGLVTFAAINSDMLANMQMAGQTIQEVYWDLAKNYGFVWLGLMLGSFFLLKLAWSIALRLMKQVRKSYRSILSIYLLLIILTMFLFPVPFLIAWCFWLAVGPIAEEGLKALSYIPSSIVENGPPIYVMILSSPILFVYVFLLDSSVSLVLLAFVFSGLPAFFPVLAYTLILLWDLLLKPVIRPLCVFVSGLLEHLHQEKYPMSWIFGMIGAVPGLVKLWIDAAHRT